MKRVVLVTGATGFIGRHAVPLLLERGYDVHATGSREVNFFDKRVQYHQVDLLQLSKIPTLIQKVKPTHLLHFAWVTTPGKYWTSPLNLDWVKSSIELVQQFAQYGGKRVVTAGTCAEYDWSSGYCHEEKTPLNPNTLYGSCKAALYQILNSYTKQIGLSAAWGRIFCLYGPHEHTQRLVPSIVCSLMKNETAQCTTGTQLRDYMHVEDVADAFVALLESEVQGAVNIASGESVQLKEIIENIANKLEAKDKVHLGAKPMSATEPMRIDADNQRLLKELLWRSKYPLEQGIDQTLSWWKQELKK